ncbi:Zinc finger C2H2-type,Zinc finger, RING/FYVE/PHD-type [Cinara cedri]|uniref:Zinc finger C2H2-type,Zinc finger, RING/FYVE/PHD-type n=1 Tax=Cinara cedri TaxID=506608 RepID=A0A5E4NLE5_9HEMI|nr:Zinc finger C2H2-type,Zinc finger, RING/FYVE/PHD-type [Cinara cedri]
MGSKNPSQWPKNEPDVRTSPGSPGRQLRPRFFPLCPKCNLPIQGKTVQQNICVCLPSTPTSPTTSSDSTFFANQSKKRNKKTLSPPVVTCKRQLFDVCHEQPKSTIILADTQELSSAAESTTVGESSNISSESLLQETPVVNQMLKGRHVCQVCLKSFTSTCKLTQHSYSHTEEKPFVCNHCSKAFSSKFKLVRHVLIHSDQRQYHCTVCDRTFHRKDHLKNHAKVHNPIKRTLQCDRPGCSKEYSSVLSYRKHIALHSLEEGFLDCKICSKVFESKDELIYHLKIHSGSRVVKTPADKKYRCNFCERSFYTGKDVRRHLVVHTGLRDFLCQFCPQRFGRKDHLTRHIKKSHNFNANKKTKKPSEVHKSKSVDTIYLETYGQPYKTESKVTETVTSEYLIKQENILESEVPIFHSSDITSFNYSENNSQSVGSSEMSLSDMNFEQASYPVDELKVFDTTLTGQLADNYQHSTRRSEIPGLPQLIRLIPTSTISNIEPETSVLTNDDEPTILMPSQEIISEEPIEIGDYTSPSELLSALLRQPSETGNSTPLPGFSQVFHPQQ